MNIIVACWTLFLVVWLVAARWTKSSVYRETRIQRLRYSVLLVFAYLLLIEGARLPFPFNLRVIPPTAPIAWVGVALCVAGLGFAFWARFTIGRNWSGVISLKKEHELIQNGPYRLVRHPIYTGLLAMLSGTVLVLGRVAGIISLSLAFLSFWIKLGEEEQLMLKQFSEGYRAYQRRVKRLIPFLV